MNLGCKERMLNVCRNMCVHVLGGREGREKGMPTCVEKSNALLRISKKKLDDNVPSEGASTQLIISRTMRIKQKQKIETRSLTRCSTKKSKSDEQ